MRTPVRPQRSPRTPPPSCDEFFASAPVQLESLEARLLLSSPAPQIWKLNGDAGRRAQDDVIVVEVNPNDATQLQATINGNIVGSRPIDAIKRLRIDAGRGNDTVTIDLPQGVSIPVWVNGGSGNDTITTSAGDDTIYGGAGNDLLNGGVGNDFINGQDGNDTINGQSGNDYLLGGRGTDTLRGHGGVNRFDGGTGKDMLVGERGRDRFIGARYDRIIGDETSQPIAQAEDLDDLRAWYRQSALNQWGSMLGKKLNWWWSGGDPIFVGDDVVYAMALGSSGSSANVPSSGGNKTASDFSSTNTQVAGVDEADIVETDGTYLYVRTGSGIDVILADPASNLQVVNHIDVEGSVIGLFLWNNRLTVLSDTGSWTPPEHVPLPEPQPIDLILPGATSNSGSSGEGSTAALSIARPWWGGGWGRYQPEVTATVLDVTTPASATVVETTAVEGRLISSRSIDGKVLLVLDNNLEIPQPQVVASSDGTGWAYEDQDAYLARLDAAFASTALPTFTTTLGSDSAPVTGSLIDIASLYLPTTPKGTSLISLVEIDATDNLAGPDASTTVAGIEVCNVYASANSLYLAGTDWNWTSSSPTTNLYKFDLTSPSLPLSAMGSVPGTVLNQFSLDEYNGDLRVATTKWDNSATSNGVFVLRESAGNLEIIGSITNLAPGQRIYSVRFMGERGYAVTFQQVDPLWSLDLSDPMAPKVTGMLEIPGYSSYLLPISDTQLVAIGRHVDPQTSRVGPLQLSLFDVSDPKAPQRVATYEFGPSDSWWSGWSAAEWDHQALSYFAEFGVLALPAQTNEEWDKPASLRVFTVDAQNGFTPLGLTQHDSNVERSLRIGNKLYSISRTQLKVTLIDQPGDVLASQKLTQDGGGWDGGWFPFLAL